MFLLCSLLSLLLSQFLLNRGLKFEVGLPISFVFHVRLCTCVFSHSHEIKWHLFIMSWLFQAKGQTEALASPLLLQRLRTTTTIADKRDALTTKSLPWIQIGIVFFKKYHSNNQPFFASSCAQSWQTSLPKKSCSALLAMVYLCC